MNLSIKLLSIFTILALTSFIFVNAADDEDSIAATVTFQHIALTATDGSISYGILAASASQTTLVGGVNDPQTITNTGNVAEDFDIKGLTPTTGGTCTNWTIDEAAGAGKYSHEWSINAGSNWYPFVGTYEEFASNIEPSSTSTLNLKITVPSSTDCYVAQNVDVTVLASAH